jgi:urease accessory protein
MTRGYTARAAITAECDAAGRTRLTRMRSDGPLAVREAASGPDGATVYLVGAAAGPLGGDELSLDLEVGPGARLAIRSVATTLALPGTGESRFTVRASVAEGGALDFAPEPTVAAAGCHHRAISMVELADGASLRWFEELILGRHREHGGRHTSRIDLTYAGRPLLRHELRLDDPEHHASRAVLGTATAAGSVILAGPEVSADVATDEGLAVLPLAGPGVLISALAADAIKLRKRLIRGESLAKSFLDSVSPG